MVEIKHFVQFLLKKQIIETDNPKRECPNEYGHPLFLSSREKLSSSVN